MWRAALLTVALDSAAPMPLLRCRSDDVDAKESPSLAVGDKCDARVLAREPNCGQCTAPLVLH